MTYQEMIAKRREMNAALAPGETPSPLTPEELVAINEQNRRDRNRWVSYALSHPETPVHE